MSGISEKSNWMRKQVSGAAKKDVIPFPEKVGQIVGMAIIVIIAGFFVKHQNDSTGFFTSEFGTGETIIFYASLLFGLVTASAKIVLGRKNRARPVEMVGNMLWIVASVWLLIVFPFDFNYLPDVLPEYLQPLLDWISNDLGKIFLVLGIIGGFIALFVTTMLYILVGKKLAEPVEAPGEEPEEPIEPEEPETPEEP